MNAPPEPTLAEIRRVFQTMATSADELEELQRLLTVATCARGLLGSFQVKGTWRELDALEVALGALSEPYGDDECR